MSGVSSKASASSTPHVTWGPVAAIVMTIVSLLAAQILLGVLLGLVLVGLGWSNDRINDWFGGAMGQFWIGFAAGAATMLVLWLFLRSRKSGFSALGLARWPIPRDLVWTGLGFALYFGALLVVMGIAGSFGVDTQQQQDVGFETVKTGSEAIWLAFISLVVVPPIVEELVVRGFLFGGLRTKLSFVWAAIMTSVLFGSLHLLGGMDGEGLLWNAAIDTFVLSMVLCYVRERTGALWACIAIHAIKNGIAFLIIF